MRLSIYCDYPYRRSDDGLSAEQPVALFLDRLGEHFTLTMAGRLDPGPGAFPYPVSPASFVALPNYASGADPRALLGSLPRALWRFWRMLGDTDAAWVFGPTPLALLFSLLTLLRGRRLVLGVRQDLPRLFAHRYPERPLLRHGAGLLELCFRLLALRVPAVVVGPLLARNYRRGHRPHMAYISLLAEARVVEAGAGDERAYDGEVLTMLSVGRLDPEKNPLLLADVLAAAVRRDSRWRMEVCGDGPLRAALESRLAELGLAGRATVHGHLPLTGGLQELYRDSHALIHVSFTEGVPQVLLEAFALRLPVVATAVGGVPGMVGDCGLLIPPGDAEAAADALQRVVAEPELRASLLQRATALVREHTLEAETAAVAGFIAGEPGRRAGS